MLTAAVATITGLEVGLVATMVGRSLSGCVNDWRPPRSASRMTA
jgi:hypothetical protein